MAVTPLKIKFGTKIRTLLAASPYRQCDIAAALKISNSAVSQIISGKIVPQHDQLSVICNMLALNRDDALELSAMLSNIRNGERSLRSRFNQFLSSCRCERGLDPQKLGNLTGVSLSRIQLLENCYDAVPTLEEVNRLAPVLGCPPEEMLLAAGLVRPQMVGDSLRVSEPTAEYQTPPRTLPLLELAQLHRYSDRESIFNFAAANASEQTTRGNDLPVPAVAVRASCRALKMGVSGEVLLLVSGERPAGYREIELFCDRNGTLRLRERRRGLWVVFLLPASEAPAGYAVWSLPVLEMTIRPIRPGMTDQE